MTTSGNLHKIVTPLCVFGYRDGQVILESIHSTSSLEEVKENTGFNLVYDSIKVTEDPRAQELLMLSKIDPNDLNIVLNIVTHKLGGPIKCASEKGKGTAFVLMLPIEKAE